ncbi:MAG TPA: hypothetical protein VIH31_01000 [Candidatus Paceibacterota bacterium]
MKTILKLNIKPINKTKFGPVREDIKNGTEDCSDVLGELLVKIHEKYSLKQKFKVLVFYITFDHEEQESGPRIEVEKIVTLRTLMKWFKDDTGETFNKKDFIEEQKVKKEKKYTDTIIGARRTVDNPYSKPVR